MTHSSAPHLSLFPSLCPVFHPTLGQALAWDRMMPPAMMALCCWNRVNLFVACPAGGSPSNWRDMHTCTLRENLPPAALCTCHGVEAVESVVATWVKLTAEAVATSFGMHHFVTNSEDVHSVCLQLCKALAHSYPLTTGLLCAWHPPDTRRHTCNGTHQLTLRRAGGSHGGMSISKGPNWACSQHCGCFVGQTCAVTFFGVGNLLPLPVHAKLQVCIWSNPQHQPPRAANTLCSTQPSTSAAVPAAFCSLSTCCALAH